MTKLQKLITYITVKTLPEFLLTSSIDLLISPSDLNLQMNVILSAARGILYGFNVNFPVCNTCFSFPSNTPDETPRFDSDMNLYMICGGPSLMEK